MSIPPKDPRGRRYTAAEREEVLGYVERFNKQHGAGGATAARRKFGLARLTLTNWIKEDRSGYRAGYENRRILEAMGRIADKIAAVERKLARLYEKRDGLNTSQLIQAGRDRRISGSPE